MIQDIYPFHLDNHYDPEVIITDESFIIMYRDADKGKELLIKIDDDKTIQYPKYSELENTETDDFIYLFSIGKDNFFMPLIDGANYKITGEGYIYHNFRDLRSEYLFPKQFVYAAYTAYQLAEWYSVTRFCGRCGNLNENHKTERARICPKCGNIIYPRINPAVIIGVTDKESDRMILTKYRTGFAHNALVAGFTEVGETLEETVQREVMEEVGLKVKNIRYYKSQPWGIASDILAGFFCDVDGDTQIKMDASELKYAEWVNPEDIILQPLEYSLTNEMMKLYKEKGYSGTV